MARNFSNWLRAYMAYTEYTEPPEIFNYWIAISTVAGALRGKTWYDMGTFQWTPNFYILLVGPPGLTKTTAINTGMRLLKTVEGIHMGSDSLTWQSMVDEFLAATVGEPDGDDLITSTIRCHSSITYAVGELGTFLNPKDQELMSALTHLWGGDGGEEFKRRTRKDGGRAIQRPWMNIIAGTTPTWITANLPQSLIGTGFTSRCILVYAEQKKNIIAYPKRTAAQNGHGGVWDMALQLKDDLTEISCLQGEFSLTEDAYLLGTEWYDHYSKIPPVGLSPEDFGGYMNRRQAHAHKTAMVLSAAEGNDMVVTKAHLQNAITMLEATEKGMPAAISGVHACEELRPQLRIEEVLKKHMCVSKVELFHRFRGELGWREFEIVIINLVKAGLIAESQDQRGQVITWKGAHLNGAFNGTQS